ncbi:MAG: phage portal protein [Sterolibacterium sp.]
MAKTVVANVLDRAIGYVSPIRGLKRAQARIALQRSYDGAKTGRRTGGWTTGGTSANAEIGPALATLRNRSRSLARDNPYAAKIMASWVANVVGTGITAKFSNGQAIWDAWVKECDADGQFDFYGLLALIERSRFESGEVLIRLRWRRLEDGLTVPLQLQVLESDYIDSLKTESLPNSGWILNGVEFDAVGKRVAYWLFSTHPGDSAPILKSLLSKRVPAEDIIHYYRKTRPGQVRGVPDLHPVLLKMRDLDDYQEAELVRKGIEACFAAFITSDDESRTVGEALTESSTGHRIENLGAGMIQYLKGGEDVKFGAPNAINGYTEFTDDHLHAIAAGGGVTFEQATGNHARVNYSSIRAGTLEFRRSAEQHQWLALIPGVCERIAGAFITAARLAGKINGTKITVSWTPPKWEWVDPVKDVAGELLEVAAGLKSWQSAVRRRGEDPDQVLKEIAEDQAKFKDQNIAIQIDKLALGAAAGANANQGADNQGATQ